MYRVYQSFWDSGVCFLLTISIITRRLFVYGFSKWGLCMASDQNRINYFLHESEAYVVGYFLG